MTKRVNKNFTDMSIYSLYRTMRWATKLIKKYSMTKDLNLDAVELQEHTSEHLIFRFYNEENKDNSAILYITLKRSKFSKNLDDIHFEWDLTGKLKPANSDENTELIDIDFSYLIRLESRMESLLDSIMKDELYNESYN